MPHFTSKAFLTEAVERYKKYLTLKRLYKGSFIAPCYDMDVVWHAHQECTKQYAQDTSVILGRVRENAVKRSRAKCLQVLKHDDSATDRAEGSRLRSAEVLVQKMWKHHYPNETYWRRGAMYRGHLAPSLYT